jgi:flagellar hook assembly protein FlgD
MDFDPSDGTHINEEWRFSVFGSADQPVLAPWPTRILNNVITDKNPTAYPAYYLSDDASVTITVYDIKGRPVSTILDKAPRKGGQNIKENGWRGINKSGKKLGVGLYYIHFKATRGDGKVILDKFAKVVIAR